MGVNSPKTRDYFVTINEGAECYEEALKIILDLNYKLYALIRHDKDQLFNEKTGKWEPKKTHKHFVVELKNPITFQSMLNKFPGAHIEQVHYKKNAYQYLVHNTPNSKAEKYQYDVNEIISNDLDAVKYIIETQTNEVFVEERFLRYIAEGTITSYGFAKRFGLSVYKQYWKTYYEMVELLRAGEDEELQKDFEKELNLMNEELPF